MDSVSWGEYQAFQFLYMKQIFSRLKMNIM